MNQASMKKVGTRSPNAPNAPNATNATRKTKDRSYKVLNR